MDELSRHNYELEDFVSDESFINYHFKSNIVDQLLWEEWLLNNPGKQPLAEEAKEIINELSFTVSEDEYQKELKRLTSAIDNRKSQPSVSQLSGGNRFFQLYQRRKRAIQFLVPVLLIIIAGGWWFFQRTQNDMGKLTETVNNSTEPLILTLSDSTVVSLAPHSYLQYPLYFKDKERNVYLHGNAQFSVKRNVDHPFKVHAENIVATVLGTIFNIKTSGDSAIVVELLKGKLNVEIMNSKMEPEQSVLLEPNERAVYVRTGKHLYKNLIETEHHLSFSKSNFDDVAAQLKNAYGITLINNSAKKDWRFTGDFKNSTAKDIVENICLVKKLSFVIKGDTIVIK
jgi:ferric-dicitrate binding protein FerR (iron transport regulator)